MAAPKSNELDSSKMVYEDKPHQFKPPKITDKKKWGDEMEKLKAADLKRSKETITAQSKETSASKSQEIELCLYLYIYTRVITNLQNLNM